MLMVIFGNEYLSVEDVSESVEESGLGRFRWLDVLGIAERLDGSTFVAVEVFGHVNHDVDKQVAVAVSVRVRKSLVAQA